MARVRQFELVDGKGSLHSTQVEARVKIFGDGTRGPIVQIDTFGSAHREMTGRQSQTIQLDRTAGLQLLSILQKAYG
jgi:hypothetical protein